MKNLTLVFLSLLCIGAASAQEKTYFPTTKGAELSYKYYNARGKALKDDYKKERWLKYTVEEVWPAEDGMVINVIVENESIDRLAKSEEMKAAAENLSYGDVKIEDGMVVTDNMQWVVSSIPPYISHMGDKDTKFRVELAAISSFPQNMAVGDVLPDETIMDAKWHIVLSDEQKKEMEDRMKEIQMEFQAMGAGRAPMGAFSADIPPATVKANTRNRKVEAVETVETPAGTFECYKIAYEVVRPGNSMMAGVVTISVGDGMMMGGPHMMHQQEDPADKYADWVSPEVGLVKREKYNQRGKVEERMILETYKK